MHGVRLSSCDYNFSVKNMNDLLTVRGHHLFCLLEAICDIELKTRLFTSHVTLNKIAKRIRNTPDIPVRIVAGPDDICLPCEWWDADKGYCIKNLDAQPKLRNIRMQMDRDAISNLRMKEDAILPAAELFQEIKSRITKKIITESICSLCPDVVVCCELYDEKIEAVIESLCETLEK